MTGGEGVLVFASKYSKGEIKKLINSLNSYDFVCGMLS